MVDMWMLSVAAALIGPVEELNSVALRSLEQAVRAVPGLGDALDAARAGDESDTILRAEVLANGLKAAYDEGGAFTILLDTFWPEVLFGPRTKRPSNVNNIVRNAPGANLVQLGDVRTVTITSPSSPTPSSPSPSKSRSGSGWSFLRRRSR